MARNPIANDSISNYYDGVEAEVWVYNALLTESSPTFATSVFNGAITSQGALTLTVPLAAAIKKGFRIITPDNKCFVVSTDLAIGATTGTLTPPVTAITGLNTTFIPMIPVYSVSSGNIKFTGNTQEIRNIGAPQNTQFKKNKIDFTGDAEGFVTKGDAGLKLLQQAAKGLGWVYARFIGPDNLGHEGYFEVTDGDFSWKVDDPFMNKFSFKPASAVIPLDFTLR